MTEARAAICNGPDSPFTIEDVTLNKLRGNEVLVRVVACGICHTDLAVRYGQLPVPMPIVLGHEGAGIVEAVGDKVDAVGPGDSVILSFNSCGDCVTCDAGTPTYCYNFFPHNWSGARADGSPTIFRQEKPLHGNFFGQSSFASHAIANERNIAKVPAVASDIPLEQLAPLGCGLMTGAGAVLRSMAVQKDLPIAIFGVGFVGMAAVMAAKIAGADPIIAVDLNDDRLALARELGASKTINGADDPFARIETLCPQGLAYAFDTTGIKSILESAFAQLAPKGILGLVGASDPEAMLEFNETSLMGGGKTVMGILGGDSDVSAFLHQLIDFHLAGQFPFDRLIEYFDFDDINAAIAATENGSVIKPVLRINQP